MKLSIKSRKGEGIKGGNGYSIFLDGKNVTEGIRSLTLDLAYDSVVEAKISFFPTGIDIDTDALIALEALVKDEKQEAIKEIIKG